MLEHGVCYGQAVTSTEVQQQDTTRVQIRGAVPPNNAPPGITVVAHMGVEVPQQNYGVPSQSTFQHPSQGLQEGWVLHTAIRPISRNNSETPIPGPKAQGNNPLMLVCTLDGDLYPPLEEPTGTVDSKNKKKDKDKDKKFVWNHGITCPLKNTRKRRFRKTAKKKYIESPDVEKEVKRLLSTDAEAVSVRWEVIAEDETKEIDNNLSLSNLDSSPGTSGNKGHDSSVPRDELREIFNDISSSSEDEDDDGDRHEDEDLNIMDTEDDMVGHLNEKLNESDGGRDENNRNNQIVMEYQVQINNLKAKLQETRARKKQQEDLIMKVENQALKTRFQALLNDFIREEEREMEKLASLQEQLD
ncbi:hypothetical protein QTP70_032724, partial [Hemibagrus guttatus]